MKTKTLSSAFFLILTAIGCGSSPTTPAAPTAKQTIVISNYTFAPTTLTAAVGDTVAFTNKDAATHKMVVTAGEGFSADTGEIAANETKTMTFTTAGTFQLFCSFHPGMKITATIQ